MCSIRLEKEAEELSKAGDTESDRLMDVYERLEELDASTAETKAARILHGLGLWYAIHTLKLTGSVRGSICRISDLLENR